jgi:hypothetical protein
MTQPQVQQRLITNQPIPNPNKLYVNSPIGVRKKDRCWNTYDMGVFEQNGEDYYRYLGSYHRTYSHFLLETFCPFKHDNGQWYALYSPTYDRTSLLGLPDCKHICDEVKTGFCPTSYYVPKYRIYNHLYEKPYITADIEEFAELDADNEPYIEGYTSFGFVAGCVWGDDTSWKIEMLDLSKAPEGIITRSQPFGYCGLPARMSLADCILVKWYEPYDKTPYAYVEVTCASGRTINL